VKKFLILLVLLLSVNLIFANEIYNLIHVNINSRADITKISELGFDIVKIKPDYYVEIVANPSEIIKLQQHGFYSEIIIKDMESYYAMSKTGDGVFGNYLTYSEALASMDSVSNAYPNIVSAKQILPNTILGDTTWDGNYVWAIKVSDNVGTQENEPEALIVSLHHAREPITTSVAIYYLHWLADNYGIDPEATWLVNNRQIWIVPIVNPDGYLYNETHGGYGGMWRKNRRNNGGGQWGVDPNRNYPYMWGGAGASGDPSSETYRGPTAGSEPCIQSMMNFYNQHEFKTAIDYHSYSNLYLYPWGYTTSLTPDDWKFDSITAMMSVPNGYTCGSVANAIYIVSGGSVDWGYGETSTKPKIFHFTPEVGEAFWQDDQIPTQIAETHLGNKIICWAAGVYLRATEITVSDNANPGDTVNLDISIFNYAIDDNATNVNITIMTDDPYVDIIDPFAQIGNVNLLSSGSNGSDQITLAFDSATPQGYIVTLNVIITADNGYMSENEIRVMVGTSTNGFYDDFESGNQGWTYTGSWQIRTAYSHSPTHSLGTGPYGNNQNISTTSPAVDNPTSLYFWTVYDLESGYDYGYVEVSSNENPTWNIVGTYNGENHWTWSYEEIDLSAYGSHHNVRIRFRLDSDSYVTENGWYIDDVSINSGSSSDSIPTLPTPDSPSNGADVSAQPTLTVNNSTDPNSLPLTYTYRVYSDSLMTNLVIEGLNITQGSGGTTSWQVSQGLSVGTYYWRVYADNTYFRSLLSEMWSFHVVSGVEEEIIEKSYFSIGSYLNGKYFFQIPVNGSVDISIFDIAGREIKHFNNFYNAGKHEMSLENNISGIYFININYNNISKTIKIQTVE